MRRAGVSSLASSPTMVGAVTVLITILAVFLAYNANNGLPFVPTYRVSAQVPNAETLVPGNEVRIGGLRVGVVETIEPVQHDDGSVSARLDLKLNSEVKPLPKDSTVTVRARSALGLKYLEIKRGNSAKGYEAGSLLPLRAAKPETVDIDQLLNTFDQPTRTAIQTNTQEFGDAVAGRGPDLNAAFGELAEVVRRLPPVMRNLASPRTGLARFWRALSDTAKEVVPVAEQQAHMFVSLDTTFGAFANVARPYIQDTISKSPPTLETGIREFPEIRPFLAHSAALFADLRPGAEALQANAPTIADALEVGAPVLRDSPRLNRELAPTAAALRRLNDEGGRGVARLAGTMDILSPTLRFITPAQTVCNYATLLFRNASDTVSRGNERGTWQRFIVTDGPSDRTLFLNQPLLQPNNEVTPSSAPASGSPQAQGDKNFLHTNPYPNTASPGQPRECEAGNEPYLLGRQVIGNVPGNQGTVTEDQR